MYYITNYQKKKKKSIRQIIVENNRRRYELSGANDWKPVGCSKYS